METLEVGDKAPEFTLTGTDLEPITLKSFSGKNVVLHFFPLAFTSVCTEQMCTARNYYEKYIELNATVVGVSVDSPFVLKKFAEENQLQFAKGSDFNRATSKAYGVLFVDDFAGLTHFSKRSAFVIDKTGVVQYAEITDGKSLPDFAKIEATLGQL